MDNNGLLKQPDEKIEYHYGLDIIRVLAMFFVLVVHSTKFFGFDIHEGLSLTNYLGGLGRFLSRTCVPLFLLLTGYLNANKEPNKKYYSKLVYFIVEYLIVVLFVYFYNIGIGAYQFNFESIMYIFDFTLIPYIWYINMFIGLFLVAPFINILYKSLKNQNQKLNLIFVLIIFISLPETCEFIGWNYWINTYPLIYYVIGLYIKEYQPKVNKKWLIAIIIILPIIEVFIAYYNETLKLNVENNCNLFVIVLSVSIFLLFYNLKTNKKNKTKKLRKVATLSFSCFIISYIFDSITLSLFNHFGLVTYSSRFVHFIYLIPFNFILSLIIAFMVHELSKIIINVVVAIKNSRKKVDIN